MEENSSQTSTDNRIHIALSPWDLTDSYNQHAGVTIASFLDNCHGENVAVHLLYDETLIQKNINGAENNKKKYAELCDKFSADLYYHHVQLPGWVTGNKTVGVLTPGTLMRFYLPEILPNVDKILYLDCDIVVNTDVRGLWKLDLTDIPLAASHDSGVSSYSRKYFQKIDTTPERYFNAGVLLLNLQYFRDHEYLSNELLDILHQNLWFPFADQDVLNKVFGKTYIQLDSKYNLMIKDFNLSKDRLDAIIHYSSPATKPWGAYHGKHDLPYWHYLLQTPWGYDTANLLYSTLVLPNFAYIEQSFSKGFSYVPLRLSFMRKMFLSLFFYAKKRVVRDIKNRYAAKTLYLKKLP